MDIIKKNIDKKINLFWKDFKKKKRSKVNTGLNIVNYQKKYNQRYYLLKYYPAYFTEYFHIWEKFFEKNKELKKIKIISIGCGAGIDYDALIHYKRINQLKVEIDYKGFDIIDWKYKDDNMNFELKNIKDFKKKDFKNVNLIILPKILTELNSEQLTQLAEIINSGRTSNELYFLNSYITYDVFNKKNVNGTQEFKIICNVLKKNSYILKKNKCKKFKTISDRKEGLIKKYSFFVYPDKIKKKLSKSPILFNDYIAYNILKFVKNDN